MDLSNISKNTPIKPEIELDGGYAYCVRCTNEIDPHTNIFESFLSLIGLTLFL